MATRQPVNSTDTSKEEASLMLIIEEQRRNSDYLLHIFDRMRATENVLLTSAYGILTFLYYSVATSDASTMAERLFFPEQDYGKVIYIIAAAFFFYGLIKLTLIVFGKNPWETSYESKKKDYTHEQPLTTLTYIKDRYDSCTKINGIEYNKRKDNLNFLFYCILLSGIILVVMKTLQ